MGQDSHETHSHLRLCDRRHWPRSLWIGSHADRAAIDTNANRCCNAHRYPNAYPNPYANSRADAYAEAAGHLRDDYV
jgi:hypothetical protein